MVEGYTWVKVLSWRALPHDTLKKCRWGSGPSHPACGERADFELNRSMTSGKERWWAYCAAHVRQYGNRVLGNEVQAQVPVSSSAAKRGWVS